MYQTQPSEPIPYMIQKFQLDNNILASPEAGRQGNGPTQCRQLDATDSMPGNWLRLGLVNNNLKVKLLKVGLASIRRHRSVPDPVGRINRNDDHE